MIGGRRLPVIALAVVLAFATYGRVAHLGAAEFDQDDLDMYFAAQSVAKGQGPLLPSGMRYDRGVDVTHMAAVTQRIVHNPETAARLPSAILGVLGLFIFAAIAWAWVGPWAAVASTALFGMDPELIFQSRSVRFYTYQCFYGLIALFAGWQVVRLMGSRDEPSDAEFRKQWMWAVITLLAFALATRVQPTTLSIVAGWSTVVVIAAVLDLRMRGIAAFKKSVPVQLSVIGFATVIVVAAAAFAGAAPAILTNSLQLVQYVPTWAGGAAGSPLSYYYLLSDSFPLVLALAPALFVVLALRRPRLTLFLFIWFAVPLSLHSFVLAWKASRYVLLAMPALFLVAGYTIAATLGTLHAAIEHRLGENDYTSSGTASRRAPPRTTATILVGIIALFALGSRPALARARNSLTQKLTGYTPGWKTSGDVLREIDPDHQLPVGSTSPLASLRYWGRVDFTVQRGLLENAIPATAVGNKTAPPPDGTLRDFYAGVPVLLTLPAIRAQFASAPAVIIGLDSLSVAFDNVDTSLVRVLRDSAQEFCQSRCGAMRLYRLQLHSEPPR